MKKLRIVLEMIKIEHTLFALPFAAMGALLAARGIPDGRILFWILVAMVGARSAAMAFNRLVDRDYDAKNPRTASRAIPAGLISVGFVRGFTALASLLLVLAAWRLNTLALLLSPVALGVVFLYSYTKRFTHWCHAFLGLALAIAPVGAWVAVRGDLTLVPLALGAAVVCWLVGFDTIYALQDAEFDKNAGLHSLPVRFGAQKALAIGRVSHVFMILLLVVLGRLAELHGWYFTGVALAAALITAEHVLISPTDLKRLNIAFFNVNIAVSSGLLLFTALDLWLSAV
ncbi:UbiA-like polyprenyltransferase [Armatimonas sp.]|uniref:UbiA-like polyprenyltransferase n=1 Tax=Armatimonas sp. TaxID=1872638 RepID=UPI00374DEAEA